MTALAFLLVTVSLLSLLPLRIEAFTAVNLVRNGSFESLTALGLPIQTACSTSGTFGAYGCDNAIAYAMVPWQVQSTIDVLLDGQLSGQINCTDGCFCLDLDSD